MPLNSLDSRGFQDKCTLVEEMEEQLREVGEELGTKIYIVIALSWLSCINFWKVKQKSSIVERRENFGIIFYTEHLQLN